MADRSQSAGPRRTPALAPVNAGADFGVSPPAAPGVFLAERRLGHLVRLCAAPHTERVPQHVSRALGLALPESAGGLAGNERCAAMWTGPGEWLVELRAGAPAVMAGVDGAAGGTIVTDLSHARAAIRIWGPRAPAVLAKACLIDLDGFAAGACVQTRFAGFAVLMARLPDCDAGPAYELLVPRSFARSLWTWLLGAAKEFGVRTTPAIS